MADYTAIVDAGASIVEVLRDNMIPEPIPSPDMIGLCSPAETGDLSLGLYLYAIKENREYRAPGVMALSLFYIMTAYSNADYKQRAYDEHYILGRAIQVLKENALVEGTYLQGSLGQANEVLRVEQFFITPDDMQKIWLFPNVPYRSSVGYIVSPVLIDTFGVGGGPRVG